MSISIKLLIPIFLFSILLPSILNVKFPNKEYLEFVEEFTNIKKEEFSKFLNNSVFLRDLLTHIDQYIGDSKYLKTNPKHSQLRQARMEFWTNFREHYNLMQYRDLIGRALIVKGAKTEEIEYKLNRMKDKEALDILRDYYEYCQQKIKDIEKEMNEKANKQLQHLLMSEYVITYSSLPEDDKICPICHEEFEEYINNEKVINKLKCGHIFHQDCIINWALSDNENRYKCPLCREEIEFNEAHKEFKERMKKAGFTFEDDVHN